MSQDGGEVISGLLDKMEDGSIVEITANGDTENYGLKIHKPPFNTVWLKELKSKIHCVMMEMLPFNAYFCRYLELKYYNPTDYKLNDLFEMRIMKWKGMIWNIISIPLADEHYLHEVAKKSGHIVKSDSTAILFDENGEHQFPLYGQNWRMLSVDSDNKLADEDQKMEELEKEFHTKGKVE